MCVCVGMIVKKWILWMKQTQSYLIVLCIQFLKDSVKFNIRVQSLDQKRIPFVLSKYRE